MPSSRRRHDKQREKRRSLALQAQLSFLSAAVVYKRGLVQTLRNCRTRTRITHTRTTSTVVVSTTPSRPAAGEEKCHAGEVEVAFKMTHLRMAYSSRGPSTTNQAENARQPASAHHDGSHRPSFIVGGRHGSPICRQPILYPYFRSADGQSFGNVSPSKLAPMSFRDGSPEGKSGNFSRSFD